MDASSYEDKPEDVADTRLPAWLLPEADPEKRAKMRPDILIVQSVAADGHNTANNPREGMKGRIVIVEVGYCQRLIRQCLAANDYKCTPG